MNNAKMWLVVPPAVGIPVFLGAVAVGSFAVHLAVLSKTNWYSDYMVGALGDRNEQSASAEMLENTDPAKVAYTAPVGQDGTQQVLVILPDGTTTTALIKMPEVVKTGMASPPLVVEQ